MRTRDMDWSCRHSSSFMKLLECDCLSCMCTYVGSNPVRKLSLLALLTLSRDHYFRYRERSGRRHSLEIV